MSAYSFIFIPLLWLRGFWSCLADILDSLINISCFPLLFLDFDIEKVYNAVILGVRLHSNLFCPRTSCNALHYRICKTSLTVQHNKIVRLLFFYAMVKFIFNAFERKTAVLRVFKILKGSQKPKSVRKRIYSVGIIYGHPRRWDLKNIFSDFHRRNRDMNFAVTFLLRNPTQFQRIADCLSNRSRISFFYTVFICKVDKKSTLEIRRITAGGVSHTVTGHRVAAEISRIILISWKRCGVFTPQKAGFSSRLYRLLKLKLVL